MLKAKADQSPFFTDAYELAAENMAFDNAQFNRVKAGKLTSFYRIYVWQTPGITYRRNYQLSPLLRQVDGSERGTGGGVVFHSPGDIVFACAARLDDPLFSGRLRDKMQHVTRPIEKALADLGIWLQPGRRLDGVVDLSFCQQYPNPHERYLREEKVLAIAMKRYQGFFMCQGVLHVQASDPSFGPILQQLGQDSVHGVPACQGQESELLAGVARHLGGFFTA